MKHLKGCCSSLNWRCLYLAVTWALVTLGTLPGGEGEVLAGAEGRATSQSPSDEPVITAPKRVKELEDYNASPTNFARRDEAGQGRSRPKVASGFVWHLVLYLVLLGAGLWVGLLALKRYMPGGRQLFASPALEVLGRTHLDPRRYLTLVRTGERLLVLGVGPDSITPLTEISAKEEVTEILEQIQAGKFDVHLDHRGLEPSVNRLVLGMLASAL